MTIKLFLINYSIFIKKIKITSLLMNSIFLGSNSLASNHSPSDISVKIINIISFSYGIITILLTIIFIVINIIRKECNLMTCFTIHFAFSLVLNGVTFLMKDPPGETGDAFGFQDDLLCNIKSLLHLGSLTLTINLLFTFYLFNYLMFIQSSVLQKISFQVTLYAINWIIVGVFIFFYAQVKPELNVIYCCRYAIKAPVTFVNTGYSVVMIAAVFVFFFLIRCALYKHIQQIEDVSIKMEIQYSLKYFYIIAVLTLLKITVFLFNNSYVMKILDRIFENLIYLLLYVLIAIGIKGIRILYQAISCKKEVEDIISSKHSLSIGGDEISWGFGKDDY